MKFTTLTSRFSRSEGGGHGANRRDSTVPYSPVPYVSPVQGPGPLLLPAHPALLEARQLALQPKPISQEPEQQELKQEDPEQKDPEQGDPEQGDPEQRGPPEQETNLDLGTTSTPQTPAAPVTARQGNLPRDVTNCDLRLALGAYLEYLPLVGEDEEEEECESTSSFNTMKLGQGYFGLRPGDSDPLSPSLASSQALPPRSTKSARGSSAKSEEVLVGLGIEEINSNPGKRVRSYQKQVATGKEASAAAETEEETTTPPIPPRNPARLLRGNVPEEVVAAASFRWQRRQNKRLQLAAGSNSRPSSRVFSPMADGQKAAPTNSSKTRDRVRDNAVPDENRIINNANDAGDSKNEGHESTENNSIGLGITFGSQPNHVESDNKCEKTKSNTDEDRGAQENGGNVVDMGHVHTGGRGLGTSGRDAEDGTNKPCNAALSQAQNNIGLGINVYGLFEPFGLSEEEDDHLEEEGGEVLAAQELDALVQALVNGWITRPRINFAFLLEIQADQAIRAVGSTKLVEETALARVTGPDEAATAVEGKADVGEDGASAPPPAPRLTSALRYVEAADRTSVVKTIVAVQVAVTEAKVLEDVASEAKVVVESAAAVVTATKVEATLEEARAGNGRNVVPAPPLYVAVSRGVAPSSANVPKPPSAPTEKKVNNDALIDELLEINYRGQAESFDRKISGASAVRSFSTHSGQATTSLRATSRTSLPISNDTPSRFAEGLIHRVRSLRTPSAGTKLLIQPFAICHGGETQKRSGVNSSKPDHPPSSPHVTYGHRFYTVPTDSKQLSVAKTRPQRINIPEPSRRGAFYFTEHERQFIDQLVHAEPRGCEKHPNCTECYNKEYAYIENKIMPTSIPPEERNRIISNNRSLRNIKNELEALAETGAISDEQFDKVMSALPAESPLSGASRSASAVAQAPPTAALNNLNLGNTASPPSYAATTSPLPPTPSLPDRNTPSKPEIARATALYRYAEQGDCNFEVGDEIAVHEYMNADWWLGKNLRTGQEGVFPVNYVQIQTNPTPPFRPGSNAAPAHNQYYNQDKSNTHGFAYPPQPQYHQAPPQAGPSNPYNSAAPPMQVAEESGEGKDGKGAEMGKKFGKKLGNAAIFGAGATIGSELVHSIF